VSTILLLGKTGQVGHELLQTLAPLGTLVAPGRAELDLAKADSIREVVLGVKPDVIVNAAGLTNVDAVQTQPELAMQINAVATDIIAGIAEQIGALVVHYSTTFVFDGSRREAYTEDDQPNPINTYGRSKLAAEQAIQASNCDHIILRANWTYSSRRTNFVLKMLELARAASEISVVDDQTGAPTWARAYAAATAKMLTNPHRLREHSGVYNLSADGQCTRYLWAESIIQTAKQVTGNPDGWARLARTSTRDFPALAPRPLYTLTNNRKIREVLGIELKSWDATLGEFMTDHYRSSNR
jgi:dTDP-4-dehydrorhamnose reductase